MKKSGVTRGIKAVLLVGGPGTRLRPLTDNCPKPILPVLNRPFLEHTLACLKQFNINDVVLTMSYLPEIIQAYFGDGKRFGMNLIYCHEKEPLGTAGAVKNASAYLDSPFVVLNGDNVFLEMNFNEVLAFHQNKKAKATIFLTRVKNPSAYGVVEIDDNQKVQRFVEKPPPGTETTDMINAGGYILEPEVLEHIPAGQHYMFEKGLFPRLLDIDQPVYGYTYKGYWLDMGTPQKYYNLNMDLLLAKTKSPLHIKYDSDARDNDIHPSVKITGPLIIDRGCKIGPGVSIKGPVIIGKECIIHDGVSLEKAILWDNISIGKNSQLNKCIIASNTVIADNSKIKDSVITPSKTVPLSKE